MTGHDGQLPSTPPRDRPGHSAGTSISSWTAWGESPMSETVSRLQRVIPTLLHAFDRDNYDNGGSWLSRERERDQEGSSIDWAHEQAKERARLKLLHELRGLKGLRARLWDSMIPWIVVVATGVTVGVLAASLDILSAWLSDLRAGACRDMYWAPKAICCTGLDPGETCNSWKSWADMASDPGTHILRRSLVSSILYLVFGVLFAFLASLFVKTYAVWAMHTGIPEIKAILGGFIISDFLSAWTLVIKALGLPLAVASGLSLGKEGPLVHVACCVGNFFLQPFTVLRNNQARQRHLLSAAGAAGLSVAFGAPLGAVAFSLEEISSYFSVSVLWQSFVCAIVAAVTLQYLDPFGTGKLVLFQVTTSQVYRSFELFPFLFLGLLGGLFGAFFIRINEGWERFRRASGMSESPVTEVTCLAIFTAIISYPVVFLRIPSADLVSSLFQECKGPDPYGLCDQSRSHTTITLLLLTAFIKTILTAVTFGASIPAGVFLPSLLIGGCVGRAVGLFVANVQRSFPLAPMFSSCPADGSCISPPVYAVIGAASAATGVTRMTISLVVIMFELTGAIDLVLQIMLAVMVSKFVGDYFEKNGIYEAWINLRGYPFLSLKVDYRRDSVLARDVMTTGAKIVSIPDEGWSVSRLEHLIQDVSYRGFPIVQSVANPLLVGYISRLELGAALERAKAADDATADTPCYFDDTHRQGKQISLWSRQDGDLENALRSGASFREFDRQRPNGSGLQAAFKTSKDEDEDENEEPWISLRHWMDEAPMTMKPEVPMQIVVELFQRLGLRVLLFTTQGRLAGLVTKMDIHTHLSPSQDVRSNRRRQRKASISRRGTSTRPLLNGRA